jgi:hypothetical protein
MTAVFVSLSVQHDRANENFMFQKFASYSMFQAVKPTRAVQGNIVGLQRGSLFSK